MFQQFGQNNVSVFLVISMLEVLTFLELAAASYDLHVYTGKSARPGVAKTTKATKTNDSDFCNKFRSFALLLLLPWGWENQHMIQQLLICALSYLYFYMA